MYEIEMTGDFGRWLDDLKDGRAQKTIVKRIRTMSLGSLGDVHSLDGGLFEARVHYGPGYRLYFVNRGQRLIILLCGGDKSSQGRDIVKARSMAEDV